MSGNTGLPPATLTFLVTTLGTQAMMSMGEIPNPLTGQTENAPQQAKHFIDTLQMLEEKTKGNCTAEETALLRDVLHTLRLSYVASLDKAKSESSKPAGTG